MRRPGPVDVYRAFDAEDRLLYVGISKNAWARLAAHARSVTWWDSVASVRVERYADRQEALAIRDELPLHNQAKYNLWATGRVPAEPFAVETETF